MPGKAKPQVSPSLNQVRSLTNAADSVFDAAQILVSADGHLAARKWAAAKADYQRVVTQLHKISQRSTLQKQQLQHAVSGIYQCERQLPLKPQEQSTAACDAKSGIDRIKYLRKLISDCCNEISKKFAAIEATGNLVDVSRVLRDSAINHNVTALTSSNENQLTSLLKTVEQKKQRMDKNQIDAIAKGSKKSKKVAATGSQAAARAKGKKQELTVPKVDAAAGSAVTHFFVPPPAAVSAITAVPKSADPDIKVDVNNKKAKLKQEIKQCFMEMADIVGVEVRKDKILMDLEKGFAQHSQENDNYKTAFEDEYIKLRDEYLKLYLDSEKEDVSLEKLEKTLLSFQNNKTNLEQKKKDLELNQDAKNANEFQPTSSKPQPF